MKEGDLELENEPLICSFPSNETIQDPISPTQEEENEANHFPF
jgi:hypothetical protein